MHPMSRRTFLQTGLTSAALLSSNLLRAGQNPPPPITFSFSLYGMRSLTLDAALRTCAQIGYNAVELAAMADWHADPQRLNREARVRVRDHLQQLRLGLPALMENTPLTVTVEVHRAQMDRLRRAAELGHELSPNAAPVIETILGGRVGEWEQVRDRFATRLGDWARLAEQGRTIITIKPHRMGAMNTPDHALWLKQRVNSPWIQLAYDYSHFQHRDLTLADTLRAMLPHTRFVHVKDVRVQDGRTEFLLPGEGNIDYTALLRQLREGRYGGTVCVEVSGQIHSRQGYDPAATARRCFESLAPAFRQAGIML
jgi:sugar phosphate isomerase/epimerase